MNKVIQNIKMKLYAIEALYGFAITLFSGTIYLFMQHEGYSLSDINLFIGIFWLMSFIAEIPSGVFSDSFGRRNTTILSCVIRGVGLLVLVLCNGKLELLLLSAILTAIGSAAYTGSMTSWAIDQIQEIDPNYNFNTLFSQGTVISTTCSIVGGYIGAQVLGGVDLSYPIIASIVVLFLTMILLILLVQNDKKKVEWRKKSSYKMYKDTLVESFRYARSNPNFWLGSFALVMSSFLSTPAYNQWQLYFQNEHLGFITGYIYLFISLFGLLGAYLIQKIIVTNYIKFLMICNVLTFLTLSAAVFIPNFYVSLGMFLLHVLFLSSGGVVSSSFINSFLNKEIRASLLSLFSAISALAEILVIGLSSFFLNFYDMGASWIIIASIGLIISEYMFYCLSRTSYTEVNANES